MALQYVDLATCAFIVSSVKRISFNLLSCSVLQVITLLTKAAALKWLS